MSWRTLAAAIVFALALSPRPALAGGEPFHVALFLRDLPPQLTLLAVNCYITDDSGRTLGGGDATHTIVGGRVETTLQMIVRTPSTDAARPPTAYWCRLALSGRLADGRGVAFWSEHPSAATRWRSNSGPGAAEMVMPAAAGSTPALRVVGNLAPEDAALLLAPGDCPCGCGGLSTQGTQSCVPTNTGVPSIEARRVPGTRAPPDFSRLRVTPGTTTSTAKPRVVGAGAFVFTGTGRLEAAPPR
ncbi:hypothetical protein U91I_00301 [alpha proteobacterium U9-1i]|nr:hypothetical protein U91I_00301 [alpha proteobacterium U9-1i]